MRGVALLLMVLLVTPMLPITSEQSDEPLSSREKSALCFACFSDTHIGARYQYFWLESADHIDDLGDDITEQTGLVDFAVNLGDMVNHNTGHVHGKGLPFFVNQYKNNLKVYHINHIRLPFHCVLGNHDLNDYEKNQDNPHHLIQAIMDETNLNSPCYAMMRDGILFLVMGEMGLVHWTHPVIYEWVECLTRMYSNTTTVILCHQAIEDTTNATTFDRYHGKQDMEYWADLFRRNPQIKLWVHGHNHTPDWYLCNQSSGVSMDPVCFGHPIAFSAPYAQLDMDQSFEEDRIQIYTITKNGIFTAGWEHKKNTGGWTDEQQNQFACVTSFDTNQPDWYSFPLFMQDNQTQKTDMKILSSDIQVQLIGAHPMELFYDSRFQAPPSRNLSYEGILGFGNDQCDQVKWTDPGMAVKGPKTLVFPEKYPHFPFYHEDGRSGPLYHSFPMGTIGAAVPNQRYLITMSGKSMSGCGRVQVRMSCTDWNTRSQYSKLSGSEDIIIDHLLGCEPEIIIGVYQVPDNPSAWFLQGEVMFSDDTWYNISRFSIQQVQTTPITHDFCLNLSGTWYNHSGLLQPYEAISFPVDPTQLCDSDGIIWSSSRIKGNNYGMARVIYREPVLFSRNARFVIHQIGEEGIHLHMTKQLSQVSSVFELYPMSTDPLYDHLNIESSDGSARRIMSGNGNIWLTGDIQPESQQDIQVLFHQGWFQRPRSGCLYLFDKQITRIQSTWPVIIGAITLQVRVYDEENVSQVSFYQDETCLGKDSKPPFHQIWDERTKGPVELSFQVNYVDGTRVKKTISVLKLV